MGRRRADQPIELARIRDLTSDGRGVAATAGKTVFVERTIAGELVRFKRMRRHRKFDEAQLIEVLQAAPERTEPPCGFFDACGGCSLQHLLPEAQLAAKHRAMLDAFERIGEVQPIEIVPALAGRNTGYRRRARLGVRRVDKKERVLVGFREKHSSYIVDMTSCETLTPELSALLVPLSELIEPLSIARKIPQVEVSMGDHATSLVFRVLETPTSADRDALLKFADTHSVDIWLQTGGPRTLAPLSSEYPPAALTYALPEFDVELTFGPLDFIQVNQDMNRLMLNQALAWLGDLSDQRVLDLFCGIGNFSLPLARSAAAVVGVELDQVMVAKARANAAANGINNIEVHAADLSKTEELPDWWRGGFDTVLLDPPRAGAQEALAPIAATGARTILYVSCHPGSLARDAGILEREHGYRLVRAGAMDMFPQTSHVESMALFRKES